MTLLRCAPGSLARRILVAILVGTLAGCGFTRPATVKQTYLLQTQPPASPAATPRPTTLKIGVVDVAVPYRGKGLVYRETDERYVADFYNEFLVPPAAMFTESIGAWLADAKVFRDVLPAAANADGDYVLVGFISELYGDDRDHTQPAAVLNAKFFLIDNRTVNSVPFWQTEIRQRVALSTRSHDALIVGWGTAWTAILTELARQLATVQFPAK
jgi:uncharacterized lipoprotein YmbA